jgi:hypothetical protein
VGAHTPFSRVGSLLFFMGSELSLQQLKITNNGASALRIPLSIHLIYAATHRFALTAYSSNLLLYKNNTIGPNDSSMIAIPVTIPKLVTIVAQHCSFRRTITWHGTAINSSSTLPFSNHFNQWSASSM